MGITNGGAVAESHLYTYMTPKVELSLTDVLGADIARLEPSKKTPAPKRAVTAPGVALSGGAIVCARTHPESVWHSW